jgi:hypothetical protein
MTLPEMTNSGELPLGVHQATLQEALQRFGKGDAQRVVVGQRLERIYQIAVTTGHLARFVVFGSFVTQKPEPNDVDILMIMDDAFDARFSKANPLWFSIMPRPILILEPAYFGCVD